MWLRAIDRSLLVRILFCHHFCGVDWAYVLLKPSHKHFPLPLVLMSNQIILAEVFIACTFRMALIKAEDFIDRRPSTELVCDHLSRTGRHRLAICWILELAIPFVARALSGILTAV